MRQLDRSERPLLRRLRRGIDVKIGLACRAGGGGHAGSEHSSSFSHNGPAFRGGHSPGGGFGGLLVLFLVVLIVWLVFRRMRRGASGGETLAASVVAGEAINVVLGAAGRGGDAAASGYPGYPSYPGPPPTRPALPGAIAAIRAIDPDFEIETFLQRAEMTFFLVKRGLQRNDAAAVRPYVNDAVFAVVSQNIGQMTAQHRHALMESLNVRGVHLQDAVCSEREQRLVTHVDMVYRAKTLDDANRVLADDGEDQRHGETWTFVRAATARTPADGGVTASRCPACGAELQLSLDGTCMHCRASVTNGTVDWVVADVQPAPFLGFADDSIAGVAAPTIADGIASLRAADSGFDADAFLARVKTAFMALQDAWCRQNLDAGRAFLSPGAYFAWRAQLDAMAAEGCRNVMEGLVVQRIEPLRVVHGRVFDDLTVRIAAASADYEVDGTGRVVFGDKSIRPFAEDWTFQRSVGVSTSNKAGTLENTCPNCGAPLELTQIGECRYCKAAVTSGKFDWVVSRIDQEDDGAPAGVESGGDELGSQVVSLVGGAIVGGLLGSLLSQDRR